MTRFTKAHACGNDFLIVEGSAKPQIAIKLCERNTGVGADGVEFFEWRGDRSGRIRLVNADGSSAEISGNGTRCVAAWMAYQKRLKKGDAVRLETDAGIRVCRVAKVQGRQFEFTQSMGIPTIEDKAVKLRDGTKLTGFEINAGNPQFVLFVDDVEFRAHNRSWQELGRELCFHVDFPKQTNVEFVRIVGPSAIEIRIFERGVGPTTSSGTGTCAAATAAIAKRGLTSPLVVHAPGGEQRVEWDGEGEEMMLTGTAQLIAEGEAW